MIIKMNDAIFFEKLPLTLHVKDLVPLLQVSYNTAYALVRSGQIRSIQVGQTYQIDREAVAEYILKTS